jgi:lipopolysaccharide exporter
MASAGLGGGISQLVALAALPAITRMYSHEAFAAWVIWLGGALIVGTLAGLRYELAIVAARDREEAVALFWLSVSLLFGISVMFGLACTFQTVQSLLGARTGSPIVMVFSAPLMAAGFGLAQILQAWYVRCGLFGWLSFGQVITAIGTVGLQIAGGSRGADPGWLIVGSVAGQWLGTMVLAARCLSGTARLHLTKSVVDSIRSAASRHRAFAQFSAPYTVFGLLRDRATPVILQYFVSSAQVGAYALAWRALHAPVALLSSAIRPVVFHESANRGVAHSETLVGRLLLALGIVATPCVVVLLATSNRLFGVAFGQQWVAAGDPARWLVWPAFAFLFCNWLDRTMDLMRQQKLTLVLEVIFSTASIGTMCLILGAGGSFMGALAGQAGVLLAYHLVYLVLVFGKTRYRFVWLRRLLAVVLISGILSAAILSLLMSQTGPLAAALLCLFCYYLLIVLAWIVGRKKMEHWLFRPESVPQE